MNKLSFLNCCCPDTNNGLSLQQLSNPNKQLPRNKTNDSDINNSNHKSNCSSHFSGGFRISSRPKQTPSTQHILPKDKINPNISTHSVNNLFPSEDSDLQNKQPFTESDIILNKKLLITEIEGTQLNNRCVIINCASMVNGKRNKKDGNVIFGLTNFNNETYLHNESHSNDFTFMLKPNQINFDINIHLFIIYFSQNKKKYFIRTYTNTNHNKQINGTGNDFTFRNISDIFFVRINECYQITILDMLMIGDLVFVFKIDNEKLVVTKMKNKNYPEEEMKTFVDENGNATFTIGRNSNCSFSFPNNRSLSKIHCSIKYNKIDKSWIVYDGMITKKKKSTNGIWLIPKKSFEVYNEMEFKILGCSRCLIKIKD